MKIIIDNSNLFAGGGIQVATSFLYDLISINTDDDFFVIQSPSSSKQIKKSQFPENFHFYDLEEKDSSIFNRRKFVKAIEKNINPNVIFTTFGPSYHKSNYPKVVGFAIPFLIYLDSPFFSQISLTSKIKLKILGSVKKYLFNRNSNVLIFETDESRKIFNNLYKHKTKSYTVSNTLNEIFFNENKWVNYTLTNNSSFNILCLTANYPHKNLKIIPYIIDVLISRYKMKNFRFILSLSKSELGFDDKYDSYISYIGVININQIPFLYKQVQIVFMPTLLEVFSTTYLEAMYMGKPIISSDMGFAREICKDSALYCNPLNIDDYAQNIYKLNIDNSFYFNLVDKGKENVKRFGNSQDRTQSYLNIIKQAALN